MKEEEEEEEEEEEDEGEGEEAEASTAAGEDRREFDEEEEKDPPPAVEEEDEEKDEEQEVPANCASRPIRTVRMSAPATCWCSRAPAASLPPRHRSFSSWHLTAANSTSFSSAAAILLWTERVCRAPSAPEFPNSPSDLRVVPGSSEFWTFLKKKSKRRRLEVPKGGAFQEDLGLG